MPSLAGASRPLHECYMSSLAGASRPDLRAGRAHQRQGPRRNSDAAQPPAWSSHLAAARNRCASDRDGYFLGRADPRTRPAPPRLAPPACPTPAHRFTTHVLLRLRGETLAIEKPPQLADFLGERCGGVLDKLQREWYEEAVDGAKPELRPEYAAPNTKAKKGKTAK